jgi:hypothetical protein
MLLDLPPRLPQGSTVAEMTQSQEIEQALLQIPDIRAVRVVTDTSGKPVEVHVVSGGGKLPKQVVRDVQTVALATASVQIDHRIVSVVQMPDEGGPALGPSVGLEPRLMFEEISTETRGASSKVTVVLKRGDQKSSGEASGITSSDSLSRLAATATIEAVRNLQSNGPWLALEDVSIQRMGSRDVAVATIVMGPGPATLSGSAVVTGQHTEAVVRAVLDALNRRLSQ